MKRPSDDIEPQDILAKLTKPVPIGKKVVIDGVTVERLDEWVYKLCYAEEEGRLAVVPERKRK